MPILDVGSISAYIFGLFILSVFAWIFIKPFKWVMRILLNSLLGVAVLLLVNLVGGGFGLHLGVNVINALTVGVLGIPGVLLLIALQFIL